MKSVKLLIISILMSFNSYSSVLYAIATGDWENTGSWSNTEGGSSCNCVPAAGDDIYIPSGFTISVASSIDFSSGAVTNIDISGTLFFKQGTKLRLNCNSVVEIRSGGLVEPKKAVGSNNLIEICDEVVWKASDGNLSGPVTLEVNPLPINLVIFDIELNQDKVNIIWKTSNEVNNDFFTIERSLDGYSFEKIRIIEGAGNSNQTIDYVFEDNNPIEGLSYYRLKQTDLNADFTYSKIIAFNYKISKEFSFNVFPNPVSRNEDLFVSIEEKDFDKEVLVVVYNVLGELLYSNVLFVSINNETVIAIDPHKQLPAGTYIIIGTSENRVYKNKLIIRD